MRVYGEPAPSLKKALLIDVSVCLWFSRLLVAGLRRTVVRHDDQSRSDYFSLSDAHIGQGVVEDLKIYKPAELSSTNALTVVRAEFRSFVIGPINDLVDLVMQIRVGATIKGTGTAVPGRCVDVSRVVVSTNVRSWRASFGKMTLFYSRICSTSDPNSKYCLANCGRQVGARCRISSIEYGPSRALCRICASWWIERYLLTGFWEVPTSMTMAPTAMMAAMKYRPTENEPNWARAHPNTEAPRRPPRLPIPPIRPMPAAA